MSVEFKDYYKILGVPREAGDDDIKKAFRKLARLYHPDVAKDKKTAEAKFKEINEANEVLSDPEQRRKYDELGANWKSGGGVPPSRGGGPGGAGEDFHFGGTGFSDFFEQFFGRGTGRGGGGDGFGRSGRFAAEPEYAERGDDIRGELLVTLDEVMNGSTRILTLQRTDPRSGGPEKQTFNVKIPPGVRAGQSIRVRGQGQAGMGGADAGDLYLRVRVASHPDFQVRGTDLYHDLDLAPWEAVLGTHVVVPTFAKTIKLSVPAGTVSGQQLRVRGHGMPKGGKETGRGDLYVVIRVQVPVTITAEEKELWEKLKATSQFDARAEEA